MKNYIIPLLIFSILLCCTGCQGTQSKSDLVATTKPVYDFTTMLCENTGITVTQMVTENLSCLHDYTLQVHQMRAIEEAKAVIISGAGLEDFLKDALQNSEKTVDASQGVPLLCGDHEDSDHAHGEHHHENDPHIWLSVSNARMMVQNIFEELCKLYPQHQTQLSENYQNILTKLDQLETYGKETLSQLKSRNLITFHDGFSYFANCWDLTILHALEEESGSEASAMELKELIGLVEMHNIGAIFTEENGSTSAANIVAQETSVGVYSLSMGMSDKNYFEMMYKNIDTIKEALG